MGPPEQPGPVQLTLARVDQGSGAAAASPGCLHSAERRAIMARLGGRRSGPTSCPGASSTSTPTRPMRSPDLPARLPRPLARACCRLLVAERALLRRGDHARAVWRTFDGRTGRVVADALSNRSRCACRSRASYGIGLPVLRDRPGGPDRNLSTAESSPRWWPVHRCSRPARSRADPARSLLVLGGTPKPPRVSNVVFMGMGEPLANYADTVGAVRRLTDPVPEGMGISQRSVTVSTVGLVPAIARLAAERLSVTLAVSLHAPDDELRDTLVPVNRRWKVAEVLGAAWDYAAATGRRVSIEYALIRDINDQAWRAESWLAAGRAARARQPDPAQPHARVEVDRVAARRAARVRPPSGGARRPGHGPGHPGQRDRRRLRCWPLRLQRTVKRAWLRRLRWGGALGVGGGAAAGAVTAVTTLAAFSGVRPRLDGGQLHRLRFGGALDHGRRGHPRGRLRRPVPAGSVPGQDLARCRCCGIGLAA